MGGGRTYSTPAAIDGAVRMPCSLFRLLSGKAAAEGQEPPERDPVCVAVVDGLSRHGSNAAILSR